MSQPESFRVSACRRYIVCQIGAMPPHVLTIEEAQAVCAEYHAAAAKAVNDAQAAFQRATANLIEIAITLATGR